MKRGRDRNMKKRSLTKKHADVAESMKREAGGGAHVEVGRVLTDPSPALRGITTAAISSSSSNLSSRRKH